MTQSVITPILSSLLDTDAYKLHMQQAVYLLYPDTPVVAEFRCRGAHALSRYAHEIAAQIELMADLSLSDEEYRYLSGLPFFRADYLNWLKNYRYKPEQVTVNVVQGQLALHIEGPWHEVIMWEVPLLALISEISQRHRYPHITTEQAVSHLRNKLAIFEANSADLNMDQFRLVDFGTRRRFSADVQHAVISTLQQEFPGFCGTSNYHLARQLNLTPVGTQAHEWFQAHQQLSPALAQSQRAALDAWLKVYPDSLGIALTDCITMDAFLRDFDLRFATRYQGLRHDSGDAIAWGEKAIAHYQALGIDPQTKTLVFSDNLDLDKALGLYRHFHHRINITFGIGTRLTCDIPRAEPLNIVIKLTECNGKPVAKLSDSPGKTICQDPQFVADLCKAFSLPLACNG